jgi:hypothetical protein
MENNSILHISSGVKIDGKLNAPIGHLQKPCEVFSKGFFIHPPNPRKADLEQDR